METSDNSNRCNSIYQYKNYEISEEINNKNSSINSYYLINHDEFEIYYEIDYQEFKKLSELFKHNEGSTRCVESKIKQAIKKIEEGMKYNN